MKRLAIVVRLMLVLSLFAAVSCARAPSKIKSEDIAVMPVPAPMITVPAPMPPTEGVVSGRALMRESVPEALPTTTGERMIIRNGEISVVVKDVVVARDKVAQLAIKLDGYVVSSWISGEEVGMRGSVSIRVPDEKFEAALGEIRSLAVRVDSESTNSQDVTEQYIDLEARLKNAEATEKQYLALLNKAQTVEEMLKIYDSLSRVRREIEQIKGQMQYLERTSSMSLITAQLRPEATAKPLVPVAWSALEVFKSAIRGLAIFGQWLANVAIWLLIFVPIWGTILGITYWRLRKKRAQ